MSSITFAIVTWNSEGDIIECLSSLYNEISKIPDLKFDTVIVDNASSDNTIKIVENFIKMTQHDIKFIKNSENRGFTEGCNQAISPSKGDYIFILNPDSEIVDTSLAKMIKYLDENDEVGVVAPQLISRDGDIQYSCRTFPTYWDMFSEMLMLATLFPKSKLFSKWKMRYFDHDSLLEVDQPMGAALLMKRKVLESVGGLDERFIMFYNDVDFCKRIHDAGYKLVFNPAAKMKHKQGTSVFKDRPSMIKYWNADCRRYFKKHNYNIILYPMLSIGLAVTGFFRIIKAKLF